MANDKEQIYQEALELCERNKLFYVQDVIELLTISHSTFYSYFPAGSDELDNIKRKIHESKAKIRVSTRKKLLDNNTASALIALMKIVGTDEEKKALTQSKFDVSSEGTIEDFVEAMKGITSDRKEYEEPE